MEIPYDREKVITFYASPLWTEVLLNAGDLIVVAPEDAHKPGLIAGGGVRREKDVWSRFRWPENRNRLWDRDPRKRERIYIRQAPCQPAGALPYSNRKG